MKINLYKSCLFFLLVMVVAGCKKNLDPADGASRRVAAGENDDQLMIKSGNRTYLPLTVVTIAGKANVKGYADGPGDQARFDGSWGIELLNDGTLYCADIFNNKIRKISPSNIVTTVKIPLRSDGTSLKNPAVVKISADGTLNILALEYTSNFKYKVWIVDPNGKLSTPETQASDYFYDLSKDPYSNNYYMAGGTGPDGSAKGLLSKFLLDSKGFIGTDAYNPPADSLLNYYDQRYPAITSVFCAYNGVKYIVVNQRHIYKLTPSGVFTQIFRNFNFEGILSIVANKDSRTIYVADTGKIYAISNGKLQYLVGPHDPFDGSDGVGTKADVYAHHLALSKDEGTLYFTDYSHSTIRKLLLR